VANPSIDTLRKVSIFADLDERDLKHLSQAFKERRFPAGHTIASEGKRGVGFFVIEEGTAKVEIGGEERATLGPGDSFGEIALIDGAARTATVTAASELTAYGLTSWEFKPIVESNGEIAWKMLEALARKLRAAEQRTS
jgi:CRP-like cAMP-binding protein